MASIIDDSVAGRGYGVGVGGDGGILSALLLAGLVGGRRNDGDNGCLASSLNLVADGINHNINNASVGINHNINSTAMGILNQMSQGFDNLASLDVMAKLGSIEGAIPLVAADVELAICNSTNAINTNMANGFALTNKNISDSEAAVLASLCGVEKTVLQTGALNLAATKDAQYAVTTAIRDDGDKTRAQIALYHEGDLQRQLGVAQAALAEERSAGRIRDVEVSVSQSVNQTQVNNQQQSQAQQQFQLIAQLAAAVNNLAGDIQAVKQGQVIFNSGTMAASGTQAAANTKVA